MPRLVCLGLACALFVSAAAAERAVRVYRPESRVAAELLGPAQAALGSEGSATSDPGTNALVLVGEREAVEAALALLAELDRPARTVVLHYGSERLSELEARGVRVAWSVSAGSFRVGNVKGKPGVDAIAIRPFGVRSEQSGRLAGLVRVQEGRSARIETGTTLPIVHEVSPWESHVVTVSASSGFEATPRIQADGRVHVALQPFEGTLRRDGAIHGGGAATELTLLPGETVVIGGLGGSEERRTRGLGGAADEARQEDWVLLLRAEVEGAPLPAAPSGE
jgi:type II secretory pathway component HofQ